MVVERELRDEGLISNSTLRLEYELRAQSELDDITSSQEKIILHYGSHGGEDEGPQFILVERPG